VVVVIVKISQCTPSPMWISDFDYYMIAFLSSKLALLYSTQYSVIYCDLSLLTKFRSWVTCTVRGSCAYIWRCI